VVPIQGEVSTSGSGPGRGGGLESGKSLGLFLIPAGKEISRPILLVTCVPDGELSGPEQWRMQDENQGAKTMEMLIYIKI
jgi:hypothetical protein